MDSRHCLPPETSIRGKQEEGPSRDADDDADHIDLLPNAHTRRWPSVAVVGESVVGQSDTAPQVESEEDIWVQTTSAETMIDESHAKNKSVRYR